MSTDEIADATDVITPQPDSETEPDGEETEIFTEPGLETGVPTVIVDETIMMSQTDSETVAVTEPDGEETGMTSQPEKETEIVSQPESETEIATESSDETELSTEPIDMTNVVTDTTRFTETVTEPDAMETLVFSGTSESLQTTRGIFSYLICWTMCTYTLR